MRWVAVVMSLSAAALSLVACGALADETGSSIKAPPRRVEPRPTGIVYVVDLSPEASAPTRRLIAQEVGTAVRALKPPQSFSVVIASPAGERTRFATTQLAIASPASKVRVEEWASAEIAKPVDGLPMDALGDAFAMKPNLVYLVSDRAPMTDGNALADRAERLAKASENRIKLNTILFVSKVAATQPSARAAKEQLTLLARKNAGTFRLVQEEDLVDDAMPTTAPSR